MKEKTKQKTRSNNVLVLVPESDDEVAPPSLVRNQPILAYTCAARRESTFRGVSGRRGVE